MADRITRILGQTLSSEVGKIFSLLLAGIAIHLIHRGINGLIGIPGS